MESNLICTYNHTSDFLITIMIIDRREQNKVLKPIDQNYTKKVVEQTSHLSYFIKNTLVSSTKKVTTEFENDACC